MENFKTLNHKTIKKETKKVDVIYVRVSSKEQVYGFSLDNQEKICREFAQRSEHYVLKVFREEGESAKTADRTELQKMIKFCEKNKKQIGRIVIYKVDRLSRFTPDYLALKMLLNKLGILLVSATENLENTPSGKLHETILSAFAQFDNDVRSVRTLEGMKARLLKGLWSSKAPWGYVNTHDITDSKIIAPDSEKAPIVKMMFEKYSTGKYTFLELAKLANKLGVKSRHGMNINKQLVAKIISNPIYYGMIIVPKLEISIMGIHEPIISEKLFRKTQSVRSGVIGKKLPRNLDNPLFPLRGIVCGGCGKSISGGKTKGKTKYYQYYGCFNSECKKRKAIKKDDLENDFTRFLQKLTPNEDFFDILKESIKLAHKKELQNVTFLERKILNKVIEIKDKKEKLLDLRIDAKISDNDFVSANEKYKLQIREMEEEISNLSIPELNIDNVIDSSIEFLKHLPETWKSLDVKDLRVLRNLLFPQNLIYKYPTIKTLKLAPIYNIKSQIGDGKNRLVTLQRIEL